MPWTNYHSHSNFSDGSDHPSKYIEEAIRQGLLIYGFSCHAPVPFETRWSMKKENLEKYFAEINLLKEASNLYINILASLEIDYIPGLINPADEFFGKYPLDYKIGSVHFVDAFDDGIPWGIDGPPELFRAGFEKIWKGDSKKAVQRYYHLLREMIEVGQPDIIGHIDKIRMHNEGNQYFSEEEKWYRQEVIQSLEVIRGTRCLLEVNTRGMYRGNKKEPYPSLWVIREAAKMKLPIVLNSDAHKPHEITSSFADTSAMLKECGYDAMHNLIDGKWLPLPFNEYGFIL
jgi:histidinol-phosphatase (PHP family)